MFVLLRKFGSPRSSDCEKSKDENKNDANYFIGQWSIREFDEEEKKKREEKSKCDLYHLFLPFSRDPLHLFR